MAPPLLSPCSPGTSNLSSHPCNDFVHKLWWQCPGRRPLLSPPSPSYHHSAVHAAHGHSVPDCDQRHGAAVECVPPFCTGSRHTSRRLSVTGIWCSGADDCGPKCNGDQVHELTKCRYGGFVCQDGSVYAVRAPSMTAPCTAPERLRHGTAPAGNGSGTAPPDPRSPALHAAAAASGPAPRPLPRHLHAIRQQPSILRAAPVLREHGGHSYYQLPLFSHRHQPGASPFARAAAGALFAAGGLAGLPDRHQPDLHAVGDGHVL